MAKRWPSKDADETADYGLDWSARLGDDDRILTSSWTVPPGLTAGQDRFTPTLAVVWLGGGAENATYDIVNIVSTAGLRRYKQTVTIRIKSK